MTKKSVPVNTPLLSGNEKKYLIECVDTGWISSEGEFIKRFENKFATYIGRQHGISVSSGSAALDIAVQALNIAQGDEVIMPAFTIISPALSVVRAGATPVLVDCDPATWNMDVSQIESRITSHTKAIIVVHIYGLPVDMDPVLQLCKKYKLKLIEDAAEMHGQTYNGKMCGSFGDLSIFSFYPNKHITTGEGGMLLTNDEALKERCQKLRNLAFEPGRRFIHKELGWNYRMTNMQAAIGLAQLENIENHLVKKRDNGRLYSERLKNISGFQLPLASAPYAECIYWVYGLVAETEEKCVTTTKALADLGIGTRPFFWCMHEQPVFLKMGLFHNEKYPHSEKIARNGFYLPSGLGLTHADIEYVADNLIQISQ
ncbi:MAG TPA: DegT/DnrJ/EryC1/StrS family aminotransferase [Flavitalea sp.]|nr:DegT/DnrJ/EryC1/StrS family aminotransferase [Flavitalea sp.]